MLVERPARMPCAGASRWSWRISSVLDRAEHRRRTLGVGICGEGRVRWQDSPWD